MATFLKEEEYDRCVIEFYSAAVGRSDWPAACARLAGLLDLWFLQITGIDKRTGASRFSWDGGGAPPEAWVDYFTRYHAINPRIPYGVRLQVGAWQHDHQDLPAHVRDESPFFKDFMIPYGGGLCSATKLLEDDEMMVILAAQVDYGRSPLTETELDFLERLRGHLLQAIEVYRTVQRGRSESLIARTLLDALEQPVVLVDEALFIHHANRTARELLRCSSSLSETNGTLRCRRASDADRLVLAMRQLGLSEDPGPAGTATHVVLRLGESLGAAELLVIAVGVRPEATMTMFGELPRALLLLHPLQASARIDPFIAAHAFGLSPAEAQVASVFAHGQSVASIAKQRNVSLETVKSQIKSVYRKVGASRQAELARILAFIPRTNLEHAARQVVS